MLPTFTNYKLDSYLIINDHTQLFQFQVHTLFYPASTLEGLS